MTGVALTILAPLAAAAIILALHRQTASPYLALLGTAAGLAGSVATLVRVSGGMRYGAEFAGLPEYPLRLSAGPETALFSTVVAVAGLLILIYAVGYTAAESDRVRFFAGMSFFVAAMQALVLAGDWVLLLAAWELIGLASYLLIGHYLERDDARRGATRAFLYTRTADLGLYVGIFILVTASGTTEIAQTLSVSGPAAVAAGLLFLVSAAGKSAQAPFQGWLSDAMAGPTPVSALLHSAALVAAGAVLLIRAYPLLPPAVLLAVGIVGGATAVIAGLTALAESGEGGDLKRLLAASTSAQYGFMLLAVGAGSPVAAAFHLVAHAAMKSSLFLGAGIFQHARGSTAVSALHGAGREHRLAAAGFAVAGLALAGVPPLSGFFSKDAVLAAALESPYAWILLPLILAGTLLTGIYIGRALRVLLAERTETGAAVEGLHWMLAGLLGLAALAAALGIFKRPLTGLLGAGLPESTAVAAAGLVLAVGGLAGGYLLPPQRMLGAALGLARRGFRLSGGYDALVARPALATARAVERADGGLHAGVIGVGRIALALAQASRISDERGIDRLIAAIVRGSRRFGGRARTLQSGLVHKELALAAAGAALILVVLTAGALLGLAAAAGA